MSDNTYKSAGLMVIGEDPQSWTGTPRTIIVLGLARGGTSLVAGALESLGVFMGDGSCPPVFEDLRIGEAIAQGRFSAVDGIIEDYNNSCNVSVRLSPAGYLFNAMTFPTEDSFINLNIGEGTDDGPWFEPYRIATIFCLIEYFRSIKT